MKDTNVGFYSDHIEPRWVARASGLKLLDPRRRVVAGRARGRVLEIGMGSCNNFKFYDAAKIEKLWGLEPNQTMRRLATPRIRRLPFEVELIDLPGEEIPLEDHSVDTVLSTLTFCSIPDLATALAQMRRVLKPGGELLFLEHGVDPEPKIRAYQERFEPRWKSIAGGCHLTRDIPDAILKAGFEFKEHHEERIEFAEHWFVPNWLRAIGSWEHWGVARVS